ncbi:MAG TPA: hypothetical protein VLG38_02825 [Gammaproteobacteria bacterium]|nr:hypothetical protein [Gammaproteobacteria bacterium]
MFEDFTEEYAPLHSTREQQFYLLATRNVLWSLLRMLDGHQQDGQDRAYTPNDIALKPFVITDANAKFDLTNYINQIRADDFVAYRRDVDNLFSTLWGYTDRADAHDKNASKGRPFNFYVMDVLLFFRIAFDYRDKETIDLPKSDLDRLCRAFIYDAWIRSLAERGYWDQKANALIRVKMLMGHFNTTDGNISTALAMSTFTNYLLSHIEPIVTAHLKEAHANLRREFAEPGNDVTDSTKFLYAVETAFYDRINREQAKWDVTALSQIKSLLASTMWFVMWPYRSTVGAITAALATGIAQRPYHRALTPASVSGNNSAPVNLPPTIANQLGRNTTLIWSGANSNRLGANQPAFSTTETQGSGAQQSVSSTTDTHDKDTWDNSWWPGLTGG